MADKTQEESEAYVKAYELDRITAKIDTLITTIKEQTAAYVLKSTYDLDNMEKDNRLEKLEKRDLNRSRAIWILIPIVAAQLASFAWGLLVNSGRLGG